jgi:pimeloyl-ACP methyl ester carboxylesterase
MSPPGAGDEELAVHLGRVAAASGIDAEDVTPPGSRFIQVDGARFHLLDWGGPGPPVLLLHGYGLTAHTWDAVALGTRSRVRCIALDQRGHGETDWGSREDYLLDARAEATAGVLDALGLAEVAVVGQSLGGLVGLSLAAREPRRVAALAVVDVSPFTAVTAGVGPAFRERTYASVDDALEIVRRAAPRRDPELLRRNLHFSLRELPDGRWTWRHDQRAEMLRPQPPEARNRALVARLGLVACPTLVVRAAESETVTEEAAARLAEALPDARSTTIPDAGHNVQGDNPRVLVEALLRFLGDLGYG